MKPLNVIIQPRLGAGGATTNVRLATTGSGAATGIGGVPWEMAIVRRPRLSIELMSLGLSGAFSLGRGDMVLNLKLIRQVDVSTLFWPGAAITIYDGTDLDLTTAPVEFTGFITTASRDLETDQLALNLTSSIDAIDKPLLFNEFDGSGGLGGDADYRGKPKPAGFGTVKNVEPIWFDTTNNIGMIDGYGNCTAITALFEGANDFGAKVADYADYATLLARIVDKTVAPGRWATCVAQGLIGLGAPPFRPITADATFGSNRPGALIQRLITVHAGVAGGLVDAAAFNALDVAVNRAVHYWTSTPRQLPDLIQAIAASCNATPLKTFQGLYSIARAFGGTNVATIDRQAPANKPRVTKWRTLDADPPTWRMKMRAARPGVVLTIDQIMYADDLIDMGAYDVTKTYRQGNLVWSAGGAQFLYINAVPAAGQALPVAPATATAYWSRTKAPPAAGDLYYADGTLIEALKPAEAGANITGTHTAAAITGQGALATQSATTPSQVGIVDQENLVQDPAFGDATYWNFSTWTTSSETLATNVSTGMGVVLAAKSQVGNGTTSQATASMVTNTAYYARIEPNKRYRLLAKSAVKSGFTGQINLRCRWFDATGTQVGTDQVQAATNYRVTAAAADTLQDLTLELGAAPAAADRVYVRFEVVWSTTQNNAQYGLIGRPRLVKVPATGSTGDIRLEDGLTATDLLIRTLLGTSAAITGQGALATLSQVSWGAAGRVYRDDAVTRVTDALAITTLGTAAAITGQGGLATLNGVDLENTTQVTNRTRISQLDSASGRVLDLRGFQSNRSYGIRSVYTAPTMSDTWVAGTPNTVTFNLGASTLQTDIGTTLNLPSATITGLTPATKYYIYRVMTDPSSATGSYGTTTSLATACAAGNTYLGFWTTRATSGGTGGGGGFGGNDCVHANAWVRSMRGDIRAREVVEGDWIWGLKEDGTGGEWVKVLANHLTEAPGFRWQSASGVVLEFALSTPLTLRDGTSIHGVFYEGEEQAVEDAVGFRWETGAIAPVGAIPVAHISAGGRTYAAGMVRGKYHFTHNQSKP